MVDMSGPRTVQVRVPGVTSTRGASIPTIPRTTVVPVAGPPGPQGTTGGNSEGVAGAGAFEFTQTTPSTVWEIVHNLGWKPAGVRVITTDGTTYRPNVTYLDSNTLRLTLPESALGTAYLS